MAKVCKELKWERNQAGGKAGVLPFFMTMLSSLAEPPSVQVAKTTPFNTRESVMLACYVWGFYPADVIITWRKNGQPVLPHGKAHMITQPNGDWTYQTVSHLATTPSYGDTYTCVVEHIGVPEPILQDWSKWVAQGRNQHHNRE